VQFQIRQTLGDKKGFHKDEKTEVEWNHKQGGTYDHHTTFVAYLKGDSNDEYLKVDKRNKIYWQGMHKNDEYLKDLAVRNAEHQMNRVVEQDNWLTKLRKWQNKQQLMKDLSGTDAAKLVEQMARTTNREEYMQ
jgi:hypothetical protein